jgi:CTP:phosphocholine cytidylyltransferase-like protein
MTWTSELLPPHSNGVSVLLRHDCGLILRQSYSRLSQLSTLYCTRCQLREGYVLPSLPWP